MIEKNPEELVKEAEAKKSAQEAREKYAKEVRDAINSAPENPNVKIILRHVMNTSGFLTNPVVVSVSTGDVLIPSSIYNGGRESIYHDIRKLMSAETKNAVERSE